ncbi:hypothetical protein LB559_13355 [Mesorhizobium sp. BR1-1-3]|uniref:hypothetical protein n=1 Tax=Mesorhizobium sp. BR1-1-3 TaxID=2876651 RepID=UPI001CD0BF70|nr:hypothetical protein [Mesorhizobium sp. BR1-1-3]MBZ9888930.1 hypothetical protein [Mesorhizobium sp. BR1-1-3]
MITRRLFLRQAAVASAAISAGSIGEGASLPTISAAGLAAIAAWQTALMVQNQIWDRYCSTQDKAVYENEWRPAYAVSNDALTAMLRALHVEQVRS